MKKRSQINTPTWTPVQIDGGIFNGNVNDFIGLEECRDYDINNISSEKKVGKRKIKKSNKQPTKKQKIELKIQEPSIDDTELLKLSSWSNFGIPQVLLQAIYELEFNEPTQIQTLTLPAAILGRKDILGAAETGSGKTLAFGLPILTGILKIKEQLEKRALYLKDAHDDSESNDEISNQQHEQEVRCSEEFSDEENELETNNDLTDTEQESDGDVENNDNNVGCVKVIDNIELKNDANKNPLYALILTPTRELAMQVKDHLIALSRYSGIKVAVVVGGMAVEKQERLLSQGPEIVVATPGRLWELIQSGNSHLSQIDQIKFLAIDETDRMMEKGHFQELHQLLERLNFNKSKNTRRQTFVFSATLTLVHDLPKHLFLKKKLKSRKSKHINKLTSKQKLQKIIDLLDIINPKIVDITQETGVAENLSECKITCEINEKDYYVYYFLQQYSGRTLIFCNSISCVKRLVTLLRLLQCDPLPLHASIQQRQRLKNLDRFRQNKNSVLVATDVAARGLDIQSIEHVIHYQIPRTSETYVHRSGRTARASQEGLTVLLIDPSELLNYVNLCKTLNKTKELPQFPVQENILKAVKARVKLARELDEIELKIRKATTENCWFTKSAEEMDIIIDDEINKSLNQNKHSLSFKKSAEVKRKQLVQLLGKPLFPKGLRMDSDLFRINLVQNSEKALDVLKQSVCDSALKKKNKRLNKHLKKRGSKQPGLKDDTV